MPAADAVQQAATAQEKMADGWILDPLEATEHSGDHGVGAV